MNGSTMRAIGLLGAAVLVLAVTQSWARSADVYERLDLLVDVQHEIVNHYVEDPDAEALAEAAVRGMIESLNDPYSTYLRPEDYAELNKQVTGTFSGIGAEISTQSGRLEIVTPLEDSPAWNAGVMAGDIVLEIDGESTEGITVQQAVGKLTGERGTDVTIRVRHETGEEEEITITRDTIQVQTVRGFRRDADQRFDFMLDDANRIGYVRLTSFSQKTVDEITDAIEALNEQEMRGLIIDVRFDPGGLLSAAVKISDMFLERGQRIVSIEGRRTPERVFDATAPMLVHPSVEVVILANEASASASEILTGALAENGRALFVGTRTFGKGSVQSVRELDAASGAIKLTNAYYYLPNGRNIHRRADAEVWGVDPSPGSYVVMTPDEVSEMVRARRDRDAVRQRAASDAAVTPAWVVEELKDPQLAAALTAVLGKLETGAWPTVGEDGADELARLSQLASLERRRESLAEALDRLDERIAKLEAGEDDAEAGDVEEMADAGEGEAEGVASEPDVSLDELDEEARQQVEAARRATIEAEKAAQEQLEEKSLPEPEAAEPAGVE
ncbi:MAG: S41 family peptidase [Planctomycetota bacterium]